MITSQTISQAKILVVDDQKLHALYLEKVLHQEGFQNIRCVSEPIKVLTVFQEFQPDLIVLDLLMPQLDGFQIMKMLNEFRSGHYLPILALSEEKSSEIRLRALQSGASDFLNQPYENIEIIFRIRNLLETRALHMQVENQNKILEIKVRERTGELRETQLDIIHRLAQAAECRDNETGLHIIRMSRYCEKLGQAIGMSDEDCELLLHASPLHDVGKIGIPDNILLKPGRLTPEEFEVMKQHPVLGAQLLAGSNSPVMKIAQTIALTHQEKWDGTGYPNHLKGDEIPLVGQICAVCDVFDALTTERPYKKAWTPTEAIDQMIKEKGTHFQPRLVDRFIEIFPEIALIMKKAKP